jgi:Tfp pilus assembly protein PilF
MSPINIITGLNKTIGAVALAVSIICTLAGCSTVTSTDNKATLFADNAFKQSNEQIVGRDLFQLSPEMQRFLQARLDDPAYGFRTKGLQQALIDSLYTQGELRIDYDASMTRSASETFATKSGNCLSLVLMTAAFAKALGLEVTYQRVQVDDTWSRSNSLLLAAGHVNVTLGKRPLATVSTTRQNHDALTVDFFPPEATVGQRAWTIEERTVVAMFMNNRAVEALVVGKRDDAYWWAREAINRDPNYLPAYNTLGVIYRRHGLFANAEVTFREIISRDSANTNAIANLSTVLRDLNREPEARLLDQRLASLSSFGEYAPFHFFHIGMSQFRLGEYALARDAFRTELKKNSYSEEVHYWLARAYVQLNDMRHAREHLNLAVQHSATQNSRAIYAAKLDYLKTVRRQ